MRRGKSFVLMIRRPPRSTLFPHDALPISGEPEEGRVGPGDPAVNVPVQDRDRVRLEQRPEPAFALPQSVFGPLPRSEEHTFELQSRQYLVCRLLLEKKKRRLTSVPDTLHT